MQKVENVLIARKMCLLMINLNLTHSPGLTMYYAGFFVRFADLFIDSFFVWLVSAFFLRSLFTAPIGIVIALLYFIIFETSELRATPGKFFMGLAVVRSDGSRLDVKHAFIRFFSIWLTRLTVGIGYLISLFTEKKQTLHDFIADTVVVRQQYSDLNFWEAWVRQFRFLFSEHEKHTPSSVTVSLEDLYHLHQKGILTDEEYKVKKEEYLKRL